jgi:hypothetical protein
MPVNLLDIQKKLTDFSAQVKARNEKIALRQKEITNLIDSYANRLAELRERVSRAAEVTPRLRCAVPVREPLDTVVPLSPLPDTFTILAADGSQINPNRHARIAFCVINVGVVIMRRGSGEAPKIHTQSQLLDYDSLFLPGGGVISEGMVALMRDLREREALIEFSDGLHQPAISMSDGPLELYREPSESRQFTKTLDEYLTVLKKLQEKQLMTLGYVDKPGSDLIGRLLELVQLTDEDLKAYNQRQRRFEGVNDLNLMRRLLQNPGDRSAIFAIHSPTALRFRQDLALHFFYLNVGQPQDPHIARVEIPRWIADDPQMVNTLQSVLTEQATIMGTRPYPYILHRAHEEAIVTMPEHQHVEEMIVAEFRRRGIPVAEPSNKQQLKNLPTTKKRYAP